MTETKVKLAQKELERGSGSRKKSLLVQVTEGVKIGSRCPNYVIRHLSPSFTFAFSSELPNERPKMTSSSSRIVFLQLRNTNIEFIIIDISGDYSN